MGALPAEGLIISNICDLEERLAKDLTKEGVGEMSALL